MHDIISCRVEKYLVRAASRKLVDFDAKVISARVRQVVMAAKAVGFQFTGRVQTSSSLPYLIALALCKTKYTDYVFPAELRVWQDGAIHLIVHCATDMSSDSDQTKQIFWVRMLSSGTITQVLNFDKILHGKGGRTYAHRRAVKQIRAAR